MKYAKYNWRDCPRCGDGRYEVFRTHSYCPGCNYSDDDLKQYDQVPDWVLEILGTRDQKKSKKNKFSEGDV